MQARAEPFDFTPPLMPVGIRSGVLAVLAHVLLAIALTLGVQWKRDSDSITVEAELWSATVQQAAPREVVAPVPPPPREQPAVVPPPPPVNRDADIALEREREAERQRRVQDQAQAQARQQEAERQKVLAERKRQDESKKQALAKQAVDDRKRDEQAKATAATAAKQDEARREAIRQENLQRMQGLAGATGGPSASGTAMRSSGPSDSYGGRIRSRVRPNIVFTENLAGNPTTVVEVRMAPDGTITSKRIVKPSGVKSWDDAVLRALDRTEILPRDIDGQVHTPLEIEFRPRG